MRTQTLLTFLCILASLPAFCQTDADDSLTAYPATYEDGYYDGYRTGYDNGVYDIENTIDPNTHEIFNPTKYVRIYEYFKDAAKKPDSIQIYPYLVTRDQTYKKNKTGNIFDDSAYIKKPYKLTQIKSYIDKESDLKIFFDLQKIVNDAEFEGELTLKAFIGDREIEILPYYSVIGEEKTRIGLTNVDISEFQKGITNFKHTMNKLIYNDYSFNYSYDSYYSITDFDDLFDFIDGTIRQYKEMTADSSETKKFRETFEKNKNSENSYYPENLLYSLKFYLKPYINESIYYELINNFDNYTIKEFQDELIEMRDIIIVGKNSIKDTITEYRVQEIKEARQSLEDALEKMGYYKALKDSSEEVYDVFLNSIKIDHYTFLSVYKSLLRLRFYNERFSSSDTKDDSIPIYLKEYDHELYNIIELLPIDENSDDDLKTQIKNYLYDDLVTAHISLTAADAQENDVIRFYLVWTKPNHMYGSTSTKSEKSQRFPIGQYKILARGWDFTASESVLFVDRDRESFLPNTTASHFKIEPGFSILWQYDGSKYGKKGIGTFLRPSLGVNSTFLDFETDQNVEVGAGFVVGLLNEQVFLNCGWNLNVPEKPLYWGIGFSFINTAENVKGLMD